MPPRRKEPFGPLLAVQPDVAFHCRQRHAKGACHIPMPHRTLVNQLTGKQTEARQVTLPMLEYGLVAQNVDYLLRFTNDSNLIVDRCHSGREDRKLKLRHRRIVSLPLLSAACSDISCRTGQFIFLAAPLLCPLTSGCLKVLFSIENRSCIQRRQAVASILEFLGLNYGSQSSSELD